MRRLQDELVGTELDKEATERCKKQTAKACCQGVPEEWLESCAGDHCADNNDPDCDKDASEMYNQLIETEKTDKEGSEIARQKGEKTDKGVFSGKRNRIDPQMDLPPPPEVPQ